MVVDWCIHSLASALTHIVQTGHVEQGGSISYAHKRLAQAANQAGDGRHGNGAMVLQLNIRLQGGLK